MWVYGLLLVVVFILLVISSIYIVRLTHNILKKYINNKTVSWLLSIVPLLLFALGIYIDTVNAIVVDIHLIVIVALTKFVAFITKKITKKEYNEYIVLGIGIVITTIILTHAYFLAHNVVETDYVIYTDKNIGLDNFRIVQISDSHIGALMDGNKFSLYMEEINKLNPDIVVLTGDFIDDNTDYIDMIIAAKGLGKLKTKYGVYFVYGNHDKGYYKLDKGIKLKEELEKNNVIILEDKVIDITDNIVLIGRCDKSFINRIEASLLTKNVDKNKYIIMLDHQPNDYNNEKEAGVDLVLSGHTHGGQLFPLGLFGVLLGSNDKVYGIETRGNTTFIVNSGISDWEIKFKTATKSEYGVIDIKNK
jgi:hypothetical protein